MRTVKEIDAQLQKEKECIKQLHAQIDDHEASVERLKKERQIAEEYELKSYIDGWLYEKFCIKNQEEARNGRYIVFDKDANYIKTVTCGYGAEFHYLTPVEEQGTLERWLKENKLYAHSASSFCGRCFTWYQKTFKEQLEDLCWKFNKDGKICKTQW